MEENRPEHVGLCKSHETCCELFLRCQVKEVSAYDNFYCSYGSVLLMKRALRDNGSP